MLNIGVFFVTLRAKCFLIRIMHRKLLTITFLFLAGIMSAQVTVTQGNYIDVTPQSNAEVKAVYMFSDISEAELTTSLTNPRWYAVPDTLAGDELSNQASFYPEAGKTYMAAGDEDTVFVAVLELMHGTLASISVADNAGAVCIAGQGNTPYDYICQCKYVTLNIEGSFEDYVYTKPHDRGHGTIVREGKIGYNTLYFNGMEWQDTIREVELAYLDAQVTVDAPLRDTEFWIVADQFARRLGAEPDSVVTAETYNTVAIDFAPKMVVSLRDARNEMQSPDLLTVTTGASGPVEIEFRAYPTPNVLYFDWQIWYKEGSADSTLVAKRSDEIHRYTFTRAGNETKGQYVVICSVSNDVCDSLTKSMTVFVNTSDLQVPNVFTPNGDGQNDEFRVAYKSLVEFECVIFNRWGRKIYQWSDPSKGWDGTINGKDAAPGTYFYIINAKGTDGRKWKKSGDINLIGR